MLLMSSPERDPRLEPEVGDTAFHKRSKIEVTVFRVDRHANSQDISYIFVRTPSGREKSLVRFEWCDQYRNHARHK
jgi:hypothetical protein